MIYDTILFVSHLFRKGEPHGKINQTYLSVALPDRRAGRRAGGVLVQPRDPAELALALARRAARR